MFSKTRAGFLLLLLFLSYRIDAQSSFKQNPEWLYVTQGDDTKVYILSEYVNKDDDKIKIWTKWTYKLPHKYDGKTYSKFFYKELDIWDIKRKAYQRITRVFYNDNEVIDSYTYDNEEWEYIVPESLGDAVIKMITKVFY